MSLQRCVKDILNVFILVVEIFNYGIESEMAMIDIVMQQIGQKIYRSVHSINEVSFHLTL